MLDANALRAEMVRKGYTQKSLAKVLGITEKTMVKRLKTGDFRTDEVSSMIKLLGIKDPMQIFFAEEATCQVTNAI